MLSDIVQLQFGFRFGDKGTHTSRTIMLDELSMLLETLPLEAIWVDYLTAIIEHNTLAKQTAATRNLTAQRLSELYVLDPNVALFRVLRRF